jgi:hypothetical protein
MKYPDGLIVRFHPTPGGEHDGKIYQISYQNGEGGLYFYIIPINGEYEDGVDAKVENMTLYRNEGLAELRKIIENRAGQGNACITIDTVLEHIDSLLERP